MLETGDPSIAFIFQEGYYTSSSALSHLLSHKRNTKL